MRTHRVHVSTDLGGDPDDIQSLYRLLHYSDVLDVEGISSCTGPGSDPSAALVREWIRRVDVEALRARGHADLATEDHLLDVTEQGPTGPRAPFEGGDRPGTTHLVERANAGDPAGEGRPLWVLVWGSLTGVAQALLDDPGIAERIRVYSIASSNTQHDPEAREWVAGFMAEEYPDLWWIESGRLPKWSAETFRGVHLGGVQRGEWGRRAFLEEHVRGRGSTHGGDFDERCGDAFPTATAVGTGRLGVADGAPTEGILKEGDSPSLLYLLSPSVGASATSTTRRGRTGADATADPTPTGSRTTTRTSTPTRRPACGPSAAGAWSSSRTGRTAGTGTGRSDRAARGRPARVRSTRDGRSRRRRRR